LVRPRLVVIVHRGQVRVIEDVTQRPQAPVHLELEIVAARLLLPAAAILLLIFPFVGITSHWLGLDLLPHHIVRSLSVGPYVFARNTARVAANAFVEMKHHRDLRSDIHVMPSLALTSAARRRACAPARTYRG